MYNDWPNEITIKFTNVYVYNGLLNEITQR